MNVIQKAGIKSRKKKIEIDFNQQYGLVVIDA